jgi:hypothetical protein
VEGPESSLATLARLRTDPIQLEGRTASFDETVAAVPTRLEVRVVDAKRLAVHVDIDAAPQSRTFSAVPVIAVGQHRPMQTDPAQVAVTLSGPPALLQALTDEQLRAVADAAALPARSEPYQIPVRVEFLDLAAWQLSRITVKSVDRPRVSVVVGGRRS